MRFDSIWIGLAITAILLTLSIGLGWTLQAARLDYETRTADACAAAVLQKLKQP